MFDRISVSISLTSILAVLAKLVLLDQSETGFFETDSFFLRDATFLLVAVFLIFFRGKMMHDDHQYFIDIEKGRYRGTNKWVSKFGLFLGYLSWLLWAPAIYYLGEWSAFGAFMSASLFISLVWALIDYENIPDSSPRHPDKKQHIWVLANMAYITPMLFFWFTDESHGKIRFGASIALLIILLVDWLLSKPIATVIESED